MADREPTPQIHNDHIIKDGGWSASMRDLTNSDGTIILVICDQCHFIVSHCLHENNSWNEDETKLTCDLCGIDGT